MTYKIPASITSSVARDRLVSLCQTVGAMTPGWVQGKGGNLSCKFNRGKLRRMWIKASGYRVDAVSRTDGVAEVDLDRFFRVAHDSGLWPPAAGSAAPSSQQEQSYKDLITAAAVGSPGSPQPSMETGLHALIDAPYVAHLHALTALLMGHVHQTEPAALNWLSRRYTVAFLPPLTPGLHLAWGIDEQKGSTYFILANHGVVIAMQDPAAVDEWQRLEEEFCSRHGFGDLAAQLDELSTAKSTHPRIDEPIPLRFYFPDTAVFFGLLKPQLRLWPSKSAPQPLYLLETDDRNLQEIWLAQQLLFKACPQLPSLPQAILDTVATLPTEQLRLSRPAS